ncbi:MAG: hypothetical protein QXE78_01995 [Nitrososphaeria archaeon]
MVDITNKIEDILSDNDYSLADLIQKNLLFKLEDEVESLSTTDSEDLEVYSIDDISIDRILFDEQRTQDNIDLSGSADVFVFYYEIHGRVTLNTGRVLQFVADCIIYYNEITPDHTFMLISRPVKDSIYIQDITLSSF